MRRLALALTLLAAPAWAQTIYPLDRAEILAGAKFDFKVEFPGSPTAAAVRVAIGGKPPESVLGGKPAFVENEDGKGHSAYWIRGASVAKPGAYAVSATADGKTETVAWEVFGTPGPRAARNVILFIGDGMSIAHRTAARIMSKGLRQGRYGGELAIDDMPRMALVSTSGTDSVVTDSANSMSAYTTGHKSCNAAIGVYCARNASSLDHPKVEVLGELAKRKGLAVGVVTNTEIEDATPAGMVAHTSNRRDYNAIVKMLLDVGPDVAMGGGSPHFLPKSTPGSKRTDETDYIAAFKQVGYAFATTAAEMRAARGAGKLLGLFNVGNIDGALDRRLLRQGSVARFPDQPDLPEQTQVALDILSRKPNGFVLMVESGRIDKYTHSMDAERAVFDTIMLDEAVRVAKDFAKRRNDTLVIVVADHAHAVSLVGTYDNRLPGAPRDRLGIYEKSAVPTYPRELGSPYPSTLDLPLRLAIGFGTFPDHCEDGRAALDRQYVPAVPGPDGKTFVANPRECDRPGAVRIEGNLPKDVPQAVHAADDVVLTAMGPGSEAFRGRIDNTRVFRAIAAALALGR